MSDDSSPKQASEKAARLKADSSLYPSGHGPAMERLWAMIDARGDPGADVEAVDRQIWETFGQRWAIMFTDLSGFSRRVSDFGILHFLQLIRDSHSVLEPVIGQYEGRIVKVEADSLLLLFPSAKGALDCAVAMQGACIEASRERPDEEKLLLCLGIGYGDILKCGDEDVWGHEVNIASKLGEDTAQVHEILVTKGLRDAIGDDTAYDFEPISGVAGSQQNFRVHYTSPLEL